MAHKWYCAPDSDGRTKRGQSPSFFLSQSLTAGPSARPTTETKLPSQRLVRVQASFRARVWKRDRARDLRQKPRVVRASVPATSQILTAGPSAARIQASFRAWVWQRNRARDPLRQKPRVVRVSSQPDSDSRTKRGQSPSVLPNFVSEFSSEPVSAESVTYCTRTSGPSFRPSQIPTAGPSAARV